MKSLLENINNTKDVKKLNYNQKNILAKEIRNFLIQTVSKTGGHLASNLGVVELTISLHSVFNLPNDRLIWDVGHQTYVHKILTGRKEKMHTLRKMDGISGFPKSCESEYDCFNTGHSSTSISAALGMARARDIKNENNFVVAIIGDGALTGGMALEALNDVGSSKTRLIVILNDNEMSISKNVGGISRCLSKIRTRKIYVSSNNYIKRVLKKLPYIGDKIIHSVRKIKYSLKQLFISNMLFEDMGFKYIGPIDGHDIEKLESILKISKNINGPVLIHVVTKKGKGYEPAEKKPDKFHSISSFDIETGETLKTKTLDYSAVFGKKLVELANKNKKIVAITAAMKDGTGLTEFSEKFPNRFFDIGIAEQHAITMAAGMAKEGLVPVIPLYSSFIQRCYDQIIHDVCMQKLHVIICADRAGIVGNDGETHQGIYDLAFLNIIPNLNILAPKDYKELEQMLEYAVNINFPIVIRYPRGSENNNFKMHKEIETGKAEIIKEGKDISILAIGKMVSNAVEIQESLVKNGIDVEIINVRFLKPLDENTILNSINKTKNVITIEDGIIKDGLATSIIELMNKYKLQNIKIKNYGYPDKFIEHGNVNEIEEKYGLDSKTIVKDIEGWINC